MRKRSSVRSGKKSFKRLFAGVILILIICVSFGAFFVSAHEKAGADDIVYKYYKSIEIHPGDTLWYIAVDKLTDE